MYSASAVLHLQISSSTFHLVACVVFAELGDPSVLSTNPVRGDTNVTHEYVL